MNADVKVITYTDPRKLEQLSAFKDYTNALHICATRNMREGVYERYQRNLESPLITAPIVSSIQVIESLLPDWSNALTKLNQYLALSNIIQNELEIDANLQRAFRRNQADVLETIRLLEVANVDPTVFRDDDIVLHEKEEIFVEIWEKFQGASVGNVRNLLNNGVKEKLARDGKRIIQTLINESYEDDDEVLVKLDGNIAFDTVVLHGFYFMTPEQQRVFTALKRSGVKIVYLNFYDPNYPETFNFIHDFINERNGWIDSADWSIQYSTSQKSLTLADKFLLDYEGEIAEELDRLIGIKVVDYKDFYEFLEDYEENKEKGKKTYLAPNAAKLNDRLQEYYPELFKEKRHFLSFPIGQFLYQLHQMWDDAANELTLTDTVIFESFSSGWIYDSETNRNASDYTRTIQEILPFFADCLTRTSWLVRIDELIQIYDDVLSHFQREDDDRYQRMMSSPFSMISQFSSPKEDVLQTVKFIRMMMDIAYNLFGDGNEWISLDTHFKKLRQLLESPNPYIEKDIEKEEEILIDQLKKTLETRPNIESFQVRDISEAISLYLSGHLQKDDESDDKDRIRTFIEIDGEVFKGNKITHVTGLDENSLPYSEFELPWPLSQQTFNDLANRNIPLSFLVKRNRAVKQITRYLLYNLLQFSNKLELSWMVQYEDKKNLDKAVYLSQLNMEPDKDAKESEFQWDDVKNNQKVETADLDAFLSHPIDALASFKFCPRRFYYSYVAGDKETFDSDFVQQFHLGNILKSVGALIHGSDDESVKEEVSKIYPQWNKTRFEMVAGDNFNYKYWAKKHFGGRTPYGKNEEFSDLRKLFLFPALESKKADVETKKVAEEIDKLYKSPQDVLPTLREEFSEQLEKHPNQFEATPGYKCRFCPHNQICPLAYHPVDDRERKWTT